MIVTHKPKDESKDKLKIVGYLISVVSTGAILGSIMPILVTHYDSMYFILVMTSIQFCIIFGISSAILGCGKPKNNSTLILSGFTNGLMSICMLYTVNAIRTPIVLQSILSATIILPSVVFTKYFLKKNVLYEKKYIIPSVVFLCGSIVLSIIPMSSTWSIMSIVWTIIFACGIIFRSIFSILQEKYIVDTKDFTFHNKIILVFYSRIYQLITLLLFFWLEDIIGYKKSSLCDGIIQGFTAFSTNFWAFVLLESFVIVYVASFIANVYLNSISTNYNMISSSVGNNLTIIFFEVFPFLNKGISISIEYLIPCMIMNIISTILWIKGENIKKSNQPKQTNESTVLDDEASPLISLGTRFNSDISYELN